MHHSRNTILKRYWIVSFIALSIFTSACVEAGIYKWRDENGKLHFSSVPPKSSKTIQPDTPPLETSFKPIISQGRVYCGSKAGPSLDNDLLGYLISLKRLLRNKKMAESFGKFSISGEDSCLVNWANQELRNYSRQLDRFEWKYKQALSKLKAATVGKAEKCPKARGMMIGTSASNWVFMSR